ncbi:DciA family protein [Streptomyces rubiginosohelvolus]|uniref:DciA family protein n=1 Tax=Streptomyces rubiginosohelvolus TaxID=67362 RepID=UPI0036D7F3EB
MTNQPAAGADLARLALQAARAAAKTRPANKPRLRTARPIRGEHRDPAGLGNVLGQLTTELGWQHGMNGGNLLEQWPDLCPQYVGHIEPAHYDPQNGRLDLRPASPAYATQLRLLGGQLCKQINDKLGRDLVRSIRVLPVGTITAKPAPVAAAPRQPAVERPVNTRDNACDGYKATLAGIRLLELPQEDPKVAIARAEQIRTAAREPEDRFAPVVAAAEEEAAGPQLSDSERARQNAIAYKYNGGATAPVRQIFDVA